MGLARVLFLADTHLGYDFPFRPRIQRRRRGPEFFANYDRALEFARNGQIDLVVHGGDILYRSKVPPRLVEMSFEPLRKIADLGVSVFLVPGNHERSTIPHRHFAEHPRIHIFDRPRTYRWHKPGLTIALAGFPFMRRAIRRNFLTLVDETGWDTTAADMFILCIHQAVDGAVVGPGNYIFRHGSDVVKASQIPSRFCAVLAGHIHRFQILTKDLNGNMLPVPIFYPGSIERTSFAERYEKKGFLTLEFDTGEHPAKKLKQWCFHELPVRPMTQIELHTKGMNQKELLSWIESSLIELPKDSIVKLKVHGNVAQDALTVLRAETLRSLAPPSMNINASFADNRIYRAN